jgi:hypothetical protein
MTIIDIAAGLILAALILGWLEQRARAQYQERMWKAEQIIQERREQAQRDKDQREWDRIRDVGVWLAKGTHKTAKWGRHLMPQDEVRWQDCDGRGLRGISVRSRRS